VADEAKIAVRMSRPLPRLGLKRTTGPKPVAGYETGLLIIPAMTPSLDPENLEKPMPTWPEIFSRIQALAAEMPNLKSEHPQEADFFAAFAGVAEGIQDDADRINEDASHSAWLLLHGLLVDHGWLPEEQRQT
jgi:hypothetical protein